MNSAVKSLNRLSSTKLNFVFGLINQTGSAVISLALIPLYLKYLGAELWGAWLALGSIFLVLATADLGLSQGLLQRISHHLGRQELKTCAKYCYTAIILLVAISILIIVMGVIAFELLAPLLNLSELTNELRAAYWLGITLVIITMFNNFFIGLQLSLLKSSFVGALQTVALLVSAILQYFMLNAGFGIISIVLPNVMVYASCLIANFIVSRSFFNNSIIWDIERTILIDCIAIMRNIGLARIFERLRRGSYPTLIAIFATPELVVAYTLCNKASELAFRLLNMIRSSIIYPMMNAKMSLTSEKFTKLVTKANRVLIFLILMAAFTYLNFNELFLSFWVDDKYYLGDKVNYLLSILLILSVMRLYSQDILILINNHSAILRQSILSFCILILEVMCLSIFGLEAMLLASVIGTSFVLIISYRPLVKQFYNGKSYIRLLYGSSNTVMTFIIICFSSLLLIAEVHLFFELAIYIVTIIVAAKIAKFDMWLREFFFSD